MRKNSPGILVFRYGTLGDTLVALPALARIARSLPDRPLHYMSADVSSGRMICPDQVLGPTGLIAGFLEYRTGDRPYQTWRRVREYVKRHNIAALLYLPQPERSGALIWRDRAFFAACGIREFIGLNEALSNARQRARPLDRLVQCECDRLLALVRDCGAALSDRGHIPLGTTAAERERIDQLWASCSFDDRDAIIAVCPGGKQRHKRWPEDRYVEVGNRLLELFGVSFVVVGGPADRARAQTMCESWGDRAVNLCGRLSIWECAELLRRCDLYLGNDTGTMHLAALAGTRCLALFSFHNLPGTWFPWGTQHTVIQKRVPCAPCLLEECPRIHPACIQAITVAEVAAAARQMLLEGRLPCVASPVSAAT